MEQWLQLAMVTVFKFQAEMNHILGCPKYSKVCSWIQCRRSLKNNGGEERYHNNIKIYYPIFPKKEEKRQILRTISLASVMFIFINIFQWIIKSCLEKKNNFEEKWLLGANTGSLRTSEFNNKIVLSIATYWLKNFQSLSLVNNLISKRLSALVCGRFLQGKKL